MHFAKKGTQKQAVEDYLKTIYLLARVKSPVSTTRIAIARNIRPSSVTNMVQKLSKKKFVNYKKHCGVTLTKSGKVLALKVLRNHRLIELYLTKELGFGWEEVHDEAEILEHVISERFEERISEILNHPQFDPHGEPIPTKEGDIEDMGGVSLTALEVGNKGVIERIDDDSNRQLLVYLFDKNIVPGTKIEIVEVTPFDGPITIKIKDTNHIVGNKIGESIFVKVFEEESYDE